MDAKKILESFKMELEDDKKELAEIDLLIKTARAAGENVADLEQRQRDIKASIERWQKAIAQSMK